MTLEEEIRAILDEIDHYLQSEHQRTLTGAQRSVLGWFLKDPSATYHKIAAESGYQNGSLRDAASKLYKKLSPMLASYIASSSQEQNAGKFDKRRFSDGIRNWYQQRTARYGVRIFGREEELSRLLSDITLLGRRLISITGPIGIGKTLFAQVLCRQLMEHSSQQGFERQGFEHQIFCFAPEVPTVEDLYRYLAKDLLRGEEKPEANPSLALKDLLRHHRLLLVIDKGELLCDPSSPEGRFKSGSESYEQWLRNLLDVPDLQSCLIWVGRIEPGCLQVSRDHLQSYRLRPLKTTAAYTLLAECFKDDRFHVPPRQDLEELAAFCGYNPGALHLAARKICEEGGNTLSRFLDDLLLIRHPEDADWQEALNALTPQEQILLDWLLLYPHEKIKPYWEQIDRDKQFVPDVSRVRQILRHRGLIETDSEGFYCLQSPWWYHVAAQHLVHRLSQLFEKTTFQPEDFQVLARSPLLSPQAPLWKRHWHRRYVLKALIDRLPAQLWSQEERQRTINRILESIREASQHDRSLHEGYAVGNLLNLAVTLKIPLRNLDFSGLMIRYADLQFAQIQQANFKGCQLQNTVLPVRLQEPIKAALSPDGSTIAIGDVQGWVLCWRNNDDRWVLDMVARIVDKTEPGNITGLAFANERMLAIATGQGIYNWFLYGGEQPKQVASIASPVTHLVASPDYIAAGLENGGISVWNCIQDQVTLLTQYHTNAVQALAFRPEGDRLASLGFEDRILDWDLFALESLPETLPWMFHPEAIVWQGEQLLTVGLFEGHYQMWSTAGQREPLPYAHADVAGVCFSQNGNFLAVIQNHAIEIWNTQQMGSHQSSLHQSSLHQSSLHQSSLHQSSLHQSHKPASPPLSSAKTSPHKQMKISDPPLMAALSDDGAWLLTLSRDQTQVQLWSIESGNLHWEQSALESEGAIQLDKTAQPMIFDGCKGLTPVEELYFRALGADFGDSD